MESKTEKYAKRVLRHLAKLRAETEKQAELVLIDRLTAAVRGAIKREVLGVGVRNVLSGARQHRRFTDVS